VPKETHVADIEVDPVSGRKIVNHYEIIDELGRGTHGKVKLGRDLNEHDSYVAIKIVERYSKRRKLGKLATTEDKVKKEVAILKKARHPNVVALLEVIDDPKSKKVYIVLEWVEKGEITWRVKGPSELAMLEARRYDREKSGYSTERLVAEDDAILARVEKTLRRQKRLNNRNARVRKDDSEAAAHMWSIETGGLDSDDSDDESDILSRVSSATTDSLSHHLRSPMDRHSRQSSRVSSLVDMMPVGSPSRFLPLTIDPEQASPEENRPTTGRSSGLDLLRQHELESASSSRGASLASLRSPLRQNSHDLKRFAKNELRLPLDPELGYVPVMTMEKIRIAFRDTLTGLQYLHYQGIVHRDIKPPNLLTTNQGRVKISDFGVSYLGRPVHAGERGEELSEAETQDLDDEAKELAKTVGTPAFYAPELCHTDVSDEILPVTKAIDVWALGITLFCMLFARTPFVDSEFVVMRQIADEEIYLPRKRLAPVNLKPTSRANSATRTNSLVPSECRHELDLVYEPISDHLHDLLERLLTKDPQARITLEDVRKHPWVLEDLPNQEKWLVDTDPSRQSQGKKIEVSKEDMNTAVVPLSLVDRVRVGFKKVGTQIGERLGLASKPSGRSRGHSNASDTPGPSISSSTSTISHDTRRESLRDNETIVSALKASRDLEHSHGKPYIDHDDVTAAISQFNHYSLDDTDDEQHEASSTKPPSRANTTASTTPSQGTVKQTGHGHRSHHACPPSPPSRHASPSAVSTPNSSHFGGVLGGAGRRFIQSVREKTSHARLERMRSYDSYSVHSTDSADQRSEPSVAVCQTTATGHIGTPDILKDHEFFDKHIPHAPVSQRNGSAEVVTARRENEMKSPHQTGPSYDHHGFISRESSCASIGSIQPDCRRTDLGAETASRKTIDSVAAPLTLPDVVASRAPIPRVAHGSSQGTSLSGLSAKLQEVTHPAVPSLTSSPSPGTPAELSGPAAITQPSTGMTSSSSDLGSGVSIAMSNPSIPSAISQASSFDPADHYLPLRPSKRAPSSDETEHPDHVDELSIYDDEGSYNGSFTGQDIRLPESDPDINDDDLGDTYNGSDDESDTDSDNGLLMFRRKSSAHAAATAAANAIANRSARSTAFNTRKSSTSGASDNTLEKIRSRDKVESSGER
jgi:[calcium/calmodulin-dependent protein kinase] kinase